MTLKSYLRMLLAAVTLLFVTSGCNDDDNKVGPPPSYTFSVAVSDVTETEATVTVTPSNDQATYYYAAVKKADFDAFESDAAYAQNILATLQAAADRKVLSLKEYLETALSKGSAPQKVTDLTAGTDYYAVALGMLTDGRFTSDLVKEAFKTGDAPEPAPVISKAGGYFFGTSFGDFDNFSLWMSEDGVTENLTVFTGEGTYLLFDLNVTVTGKATLPAGTFPVASSSKAEENTIAPGKDSEVMPGSMEGSAIVKIKADGTKDYFYIDGGSLKIEVSGSSYVITANVTSAGKEYTFKYEGAVSIFDATGGGGLELSIDVTNITATTAKVSVTSSDTTSPYYFDLLDEEDYQSYGGTPAGIADFIGELLAYYQAQNPTMTLPQILAQIVSTGNDSYDFDKLTPAAKYYTFAIGLDATTGAATTTAVVEEFTTEAASGGDGPELTLSMRAGDKDGNNKTTTVYVVAQSSAATSAIYWLSTTSTVENKLAAGETYESIVAGGNAFSAEWMTGLNSTGIGLNYNKCQPGESWTMILKVSDADGNSTIKHVAATTETGQGGDGPEVHLTMVAGDSKGANKTTSITATVQCSTAASASYWLSTTANVEKLLGQGETYESLASPNEQGTNVFSADWIEQTKSASGIPLGYTKCNPGESWTMIVKVTDAAGKSTVEHAAVTTETSGEMTAVEMKNLSHGRMIYYGQSFTGAESVDYADWEVHLADATYDFSKGGTGEFMLIELITAKSATTDLTPGTYTVADARTLANLKAFTCWPGYVTQNSQGQNVMAATWYCNVDTQAQYPISGGTIKVSKSGSNYTLEFDIQSSTKNATVKGTYTGTLSFIDATASSSSVPMRAPWASAANAPKRLAPVSSMQNIVKASVINSLSFEKPATVYEMTISNSVNTKKPLGLKKHFIKK